MLKIRYFRLRLSCSLLEFVAAAVENSVNDLTSKVKILKSSEDDVIFTYTVIRYITVRKFLDDDRQVVDEAATMDKFSMRLFRNNELLYLSVIDPSRSLKFITEMFDQVLGGESYFLEPLEITKSLIEKHIAHFDSARLVSAKIKDFEVSEGAVGRLEIVSQAGLKSEIAPFLEGKFYRTDALTYEVSLRLMRGLINYSRNGMLKITGPLEVLAFPLFESILE